MCMEPLDGVLEPFVPHLYTAFTTLMRDSDSEVRNNAVFGLGELVLHGRELLFSYVFSTNSSNQQTNKVFFSRNYPQILQALSSALSHEDNPLALDNICAAIARIIIVNIAAVPMDQVHIASSLLLILLILVLSTQVFPVLMRHLPLREDFHENTSILRCFLFMFQHGHPLFASHLSQILNIILTVATQQKLQEGRSFAFANINRKRTYSLLCRAKADHQRTCIGHRL